VRNRGEGDCGQDSHQSRWGKKPQRRRQLSHASGCTVGIAIDRIHTTLSLETH
jgi:hypothetical protein